MKEHLLDDGPNLIARTCAVWVTHKPRQFVFCVSSSLTVSTVVNLIFRESNTAKHEIYKIYGMILPFLLYGCETWSPAYGEKRGWACLECECDRKLESISWSGTSWYVLLTKYYSGDKNKQEDMGGACSTQGGEMYTGFWWETRKKRHQFEDSGMDGIILKWTLKK